MLNNISLTLDELSLLSELTANPQTRELLSSCSGTIQQCNVMLRCFDVTDMTFIVEVK
jgi:hypothetical protein